MNHFDRQEPNDWSDNANMLIQEQQTLLISTVSEKGKPESSYAPYVRDQQGVFYIFVSELASHTQNMLKNSLASLLFIQSEQDAQNLFARQRVIFECTVHEIKQDEVCFETQLHSMKEKFGETIDLLRSLNDFHLLALTPVSGKYIAGFGQTFTMDIGTNA